MAELLLVAPLLLAQSIDPFVFGQQYCWLKQHGIDRKTAIDRAVDDAWRPQRSAINRDTDVEAARNFIRTNCND